MLLDAPPPRLPCPVESSSAPVVKETNHRRGRCAANTHSTQRPAPPFTSLSHSTTSHPPGRGLSRHRLPTLPVPPRHTTRYSFSAASFRNAAFPSFRVSTIDFIPAMIAPLSFDARAFDMIH